MNVHIVSVDEHIVYEQFKMRPDLKVRERGNRKENCKITKMLLDVVTFSWKIISNKFERRSVANVDKVIYNAMQCTL